MRRAACALSLLLAFGSADAGRFVKGSRGAPVGSATMGVAWTAPTEDTDGSAIGTITDYQVCYDTVSRQGTGVAYATCTAIGSASTSHTITGLLAATLYYIAVRASVGGVLSNYSNEQSATTNP